MPCGSAKRSASDGQWIPVPVSVPEALRIRPCQWRSGEGDHKPIGSTAALGDLEGVRLASVENVYVGARQAQLICGIHISNDLSHEMP